MGEVWAALAAGLVAIITSGVSLIVAKIRAAKQQTDIDELKKILDNADGDGAYCIKCPACGTTIVLKSAEIRKVDKKEE